MRVFQLAWPVILEGLLQTLLGAVDTLMVGRLGADALAGVGTAQQYLFFLISIFSAVSIGASIVTAQSVGARDFDLASRVARQSLIWALALAVPLALLGALFSVPLMYILGVTDSVAAIGGGYLTVTMLTGVALVIPFTVGAVLRGAGDTRTPLLATTCANLVNAVVAYLLIFGAFGFPNLGPVGSAWGAASGRLVSCAILLYAAWRGRVGLTIRGSRGWRPERHLAARVMSLGAPAAIEQVALSAAFLVLAAVVARLGTDALAAQRVIGNLLSLSLLPGFGFGIAATAMVGQSLGAGVPDEGEAATGVATQWSLIWMGLLGVVFLALRYPLVGLFTSDPNVVALSAASMVPFALAQPFWAVGIVHSGGLRGAGNTRFPLAMTIVGFWGATILAMAMTALSHPSLEYIWGTLLVTSPITALLTMRRFKRGDWKAAVVAGLGPPPEVSVAT
jgi:putative MATE family efflux protein